MRSRQQQVRGWIAKAMSDLKIAGTESGGELGGRGHPGAKIGSDDVAVRQGLIWTTLAT